MGGERWGWGWYRVTGREEHLDEDSRLIRMIKVDLWMIGMQYISSSQHLLVNSFFLNAA